MGWRAAAGAAFLLTLILRLPWYAFSTAASNTATEAFQMSLPVPSPSMKGTMGSSGTASLPSPFIAMEEANRAWDGMEEEEEDPARRRRVAAEEGRCEVGVGCVGGRRGEEGNEEG